MLQDSSLPTPASSAHDVLDSPPPSLPGFGSFLCSSVPTIAATVEISQSSPKLPPSPPPQPKMKSRTPDHCYAFSKHSRFVEDLQEQLQILQHKVKSLKLGRKRDRIKLQLARRKIEKYEKGELPLKTKDNIVHETLQGTFSKSLITNIINRSKNPKGKRANQ